MSPALAPSSQRPPGERFFEPIFLEWAAALQAMNDPAGTTENCDVTCTVLNKATTGGTGIGFEVTTGVGCVAGETLMLVQH